MILQEICDQHTIEIQVIQREYFEQARQVKTEAEFLAIKRAENQALRDKLEDQSRALAFMAGEKIEPKTHFGEAVVVGVSGVD